MCADIVYFREFAAFRDYDLHLCVAMQNDKLTLTGVVWNGKNWIVNKKKIKYPSKWYDPFTVYVQYQGEFTPVFMRSMPVKVVAMILRWHKVPPTHLYNCVEELSMFNEHWLKKIHVMATSEVFREGIVQKIALIEKLKTTHPLSYLQVTSVDWLFHGIKRQELMRDRHRDTVHFLCLFDSNTAEARHPLTCAPESGNVRFNSTVTIAYTPCPCLGIGALERDLVRLCNGAIVTITDSFLKLNTYDNFDDVFTYAVSVLLMSKTYIPVIKRLQIALGCQLHIAKETNVFFKYLLFRVAQVVVPNIQVCE